MKYFSLFPIFGLEIVRTGKPALPGIPLRQSVIQHMQYLEIPDKTPLSLIDKSRRNLSCYSFYIQIRAQTLQYIYHEVQIFRQFHTKEILRHCSIFLFYAGPFNYLQLMEFDGMKRQRGNK